MVTTKPRDKRQAILDSALILFSEFGFDATSVPAVAEHAFVALGTLYRYFPSKEALVNELYRTYKRQLSQALLEDFPVDGSARSQLHHVWERATRFAMREDKAVRFLELHHHGLYLDAESRAVEQEFFAPIVHALERAARDEQVKALPPMLLASIVWGIFLGVLKAMWAHQLPMGPELLRDAEPCAWEAIRR